MGAVARALSDTFVNAAPPSLMRGGVYVPFSTPELMIARLRLDEEGEPTALVPALSGGQGYYVVPWPMLPEMVSMTVYDRALHEALASIPSTDPNLIRKKALDVRRLGLCGPRAAAEAGEVHESDQRRRENIFCFLVQRVAVQAARPIEGLNPGNMRAPENLAALRDLASEIELPTDALIERLDAWSGQIGLLGLNRKDLRGPLRQQLSELRMMFNAMGEWASNDHPEYVGSANRCLAAGDATVELIQSQITRIDNECEDVLKVVTNWEANATLLMVIANFVATAVQIWYSATREWRGFAEARDRHQMRNGIGFIETLLPVLAPSDMLKLQRNRAANDIEHRTSKAKQRRVGAGRSAAKDPAPGLRDAVIACGNRDLALPLILCWPFRDLIQSKRRGARPGDLPQEAVDQLIRHLRKTWSSRDVARFEAVIDSVEDPETFDQEVLELRKIVHLMLREWLAWHTDTRVDAETLALRRATRVPTLSDDDAYVADMMVCVAQVGALLSQLPKPPVNWMTNTNMRQIGTALEDMSNDGHPAASIGALHLVMRRLAEPCDIVRTLRHLAAHHGPTVTDNDGMRGIVDALLARLGELRDEVALAAARFDGSRRLRSAIDHFVDATDSGVMALPLRQDGGVAAKVHRIIDEVANEIRTRLLEELEPMIGRAFPSCPDPKMADDDGMIADLKHSPDEEALGQVEAILDLMIALKEKYRIFNLKIALDGCKSRAVATTARVSKRLQQAVQRTGAAAAENLRGHVMSTVWLVEQLGSSDSADRLRKQIAPMIDAQVRGS